MDQFLDLEKVIVLVGKLKLAARMSGWLYAFLSPCLSIWFGLTYIAWNGKSQSFPLTEKVSPECSEGQPVKNSTNAIRVCFAIIQLSKREGHAYHARWFFTSGNIIRKTRRRSGGGEIFRGKKHVPTDGGSCFSLGMLHSSSFSCCRQIKKKSREEHSIMWTHNTKTIYSTKIEKKGQAVTAVL